MRVECTPSDMLVSLSLANDFRGRIYATGNPQACFELGTGRSEMTLKIPLGTECGTVQQVHTLVCLINVPALLSVLPDRFLKIN